MGEGVGAAEGKGVIVGIVLDVGAGVGGGEGVGAAEGKGVIVGVVLDVGAGVGVSTGPLVGGPSFLTNHQTARAAATSTVARAKALQGEVIPRGFTVASQAAGLPSTSRAALPAAAFPSAFR